MTVGIIDVPSEDLHVYHLFTSQGFLFSTTSPIFNLTTVPFIVIVVFFLSRSLGSVGPVVFVVVSRLSTRDRT